VAQNLGIEVVDKKVANIEELDAFLNTFQFKKTDAILRSADSVISAASVRLIELAKKNKIPISGTNISDVKNGALMIYGANYELLGKQAASIADKIFRGANPASFPVEFPEKFELAVNKKTAEIIGLQFSSDFLAKVDLIVE
jgi:putative ABC transport system substrate-binding protein